MLLLLGLSCSSVVTGPEAAFFPVLSALTLPSFTFTGVYPQMVIAEDEYAWTVRAVEYDSDTVISLSDHAAASEALLAASDEGRDGEAFCEGMPQFLGEIDAAIEAQPQVGRSVSASLCPLCGALEGAFVIGVEVSGVSLGLDAAIDRQSLEDGFDAERCGVGPSEPLEGEGEWWFEDGTAQLSAGLFGAYSGSLEARGGENVGGVDEEVDTLDLHFSTSLCPAPEVARLVIF